MQALSRRATAMIRAVGPGVKTLRLSDLEWRALCAGTSESRRRRSA